MATSNIETAPIPEAWNQLPVSQKYDALNFQVDFKRLASLGHDSDPAFTQFLTNKYWNHLSIQLGHWNPMKVVVMDREMFALMPDHTKLGVLHAMEKFLNDDAMYARDPNNCKVLILGPRKTLEPEVTMVGETPIWDPKKKHVHATIDNEKLPRPANAFILFRKDHQEQVKAANPGVTNNDISVITGAMWKNASLEVRQQYRMKAELMKGDFMRQNPQYRYTPRRPHEIRRRSARGRSGGAYKPPKGVTPVGAAQDWVFSPLRNDVEKVPKMYHVRSQITDMIPGVAKFLTRPGTAGAFTPFNLLPNNSTTGFELPEEVAATIGNSDVAMEMGFPDILGDSVSTAISTHEGNEWTPVDDLDSMEDLFESMI